jgi:hypothetical protein
MTTPKADSKAEPKKPEAPAAKKSAGATVTVTQLGKPKLFAQRESRTLEDTPAVRGMINVVKHLVRVASEK